MAHGVDVHGVDAQEIQLEGQHQRAIDIADGPQAGEGDGGSGRVNSVGPKDLQNIRLVIDIGDDRTVEIPLKGKLILQNSGPPRAAAAAGDAAPGNAGQGQSAPDAEDKEFLMEMRGWLMTVGTIFVAMSFQAALQPPAWLGTTDFLRLSQSEIDKWNHRYHGASHAAVAPARFAPSPSPAAGLSRRARAYMICNYCTFGSSLALVLMLMLPRNKPPHWTKFTMAGGIFLVAETSICAIGTVVFGTSEDWRFALLAVTAIEAFACSMIFPQISTAIATFRAWWADGPSPRP